MKTILATILALAIASIGLVRVAHADCEIEQKQGPIAHVEWNDGKRVIVIEPRILCTAIVPRPGVVYVVTQKDIHYAWEDIQADLMPAILATVKKAPF
jgi:hypothetical protein